jgi:hypothetical protein
VALDDIAAKTLIFRPIPGDNPIRRWGILSSKRHEQGSIEEVFVRISRQVVSNLQIHTRNYREESQAKAS